PCHGAVTDEQRSHRPGGRQVFFAQTSLLAPHRSTAGYARRSRLVGAKNPLPRTSSYSCLRPLSRRRNEAELFFAPKSASLRRRLPFLNSPWGGEGRHNFLCTPKFSVMLADHAEKTHCFKVCPRSDPGVGLRGLGRTKEEDFVLHKIEWL